MPLHPSKLGELGNLDAGFDLSPSLSTIHVSSQNRLNTKQFAKQKLVFIGLREDSIHLIALYRYTLPM